MKRLNAAGCLAALRGRLRAGPLPPGRRHAGDARHRGLRAGLPDRLAPVDRQQHLLPVLQPADLPRVGGGHDRRQLSPRRRRPSGRSPGSPTPPSRREQRRRVAPQLGLARSRRRRRSCSCSSPPPTSISADDATHDASHPPRQTSSPSASGPSATAAAIRSASPCGRALDPVRRRAPARRDSAPGASTSTTTTSCRSTPRRPSATASSRDFRAALDATGMTVPMATTNLFTDPVFKDGAFTSHDAAGPRLRRAEDDARDGPGRGAGRADLRVLGRPRGRRSRRRQGSDRGDQALPRGASTSCASTRATSATTCASRSKPSRTSRAATSTSRPPPRISAFIPTLAHPEMVGVNPEVRARADGRPELLPRRRAGARGRQAVSHRPERPEAGPLRSGSALRLRVDQAAVLPGEAARGVGLRRAAPLRRARLPHRGRRGRVGLRARLHADLPDPQGEGAAVLRGHARFRRCWPRSAATRSGDRSAPYTPRRPPRDSRPRPSTARRSPRAGFAYERLDQLVVDLLLGVWLSPAAPGFGVAALSRPRLEHAEPDRDRHRGRRRRARVVFDAVAAVRRDASPLRHATMASCPSTRSGRSRLVAAHVGRGARRDARARSPPADSTSRRIAAISGSAQQHGSVYLNADAAAHARHARSGAAARRRRSRRSCRAASRRSGWTRARAPSARRSQRPSAAPRVLAQRTGSRAFERFTGPQIRKFAALDPDGYAATGAHPPGQLVSWRRCWSARHAPIDPGDASGTNLMDLAAEQWWTPAVERDGARTWRAKLPAIAPSSARRRPLSPYWQARLRAAAGAGSSRGPATTRAA